MSKQLIATEAFTTDTDYPDLEFGRSADGFPVARVGDLAFAMLPGQNSPFLASAWRVERSLHELKRDDFYSRYGHIENEAAFRARMIEQAEHRRELAMLSRKVTRIACPTPWGPSQSATVHAEGIVEHSTASHGGFQLSTERNARVHPLMRSEAGFYEEDCDWAIVAITFPDLFTAYERRCAEKTLKDWSPEAWEAIFGTILAPGESHEKDKRLFHIAHETDWIVIAAITSSHRLGFVECVATIGGSRSHHAEERRFLVGRDDYETGRFGFVIDPERHTAYDGPSDFIACTATR
jgi:hypothetical protein